MVSRLEKEYWVDEGHYTSENYIQRVPSKTWKLILLKKCDSVTFYGRLRKLKAKSIGCGVYEIYKEP